jgi:hypothetical protein
MISPFLLENIIVRLELGRLSARVREGGFSAADKTSPNLAQPIIDDRNSHKLIDNVTC